MEKFLSQFEDFCKTPGIESGKARSYAKAIEYLCDYLGIFTMDSQAVAKLKSVENDVKDKNSKIYNNLSVFLSDRGQISYLVKGWIRAALKQFFDFIPSYIP